MTVNDYLASLIAKETDLLEFAPQPTDPNQRKLPIDKVA